MKSTKWKTKLTFFVYSLVNFGTIYIIFAWLGNEFNMLLWHFLVKMIFLIFYFILSGIGIEVIFCKNLIDYAISKKEIEKDIEMDKNDILH